MKRAVRAILRLVSAGLFVWGGMFLGLEFMRHRLQGAIVNPWHCVFASLLVVLSAALFAGSGRIAEHFSDDFEE